MSATVIELDQEDIAARLANDPTFSGLVKVFAQRRGVTESDILTALGAMNQAGTKTGLVAIVLMPRLTPKDANAPGPFYFSRYPVQVIDWPVIRKTAGGVGISAESLCERIRQILHFWCTGRGQTLVFDGMEPEPMQDSTQVSYIVYFKRIGADSAPVKCATVGISPKTGAHPQTVTLTCGTAAASIYYSTDGSYPCSSAAAATPATSFLYSTPVTIAAACTLRAAAELTGYQQGDCAQAVFT